MDLSVEAGNSGEILPYSSAPLCLHPEYSEDWRVSDKSVLLVKGHTSRMPTVATAVGPILLT